MKRLLYLLPLLASFASAQAGGGFGTTSPAILPSADVVAGTITVNASQFSGTGSGTSPLTLQSSSVTMQGPIVSSVAVNSIGPSQLTGAIVYGGTITVTGAQFSGTGTGTSPLALQSSSVTLQGNTFNGNSQLVQLSGASALPAVNGAAITALTAANVSAGVLGTSVIASSHAVASVGPAQLTSAIVYGGTVTANSPPFSGTGTGTSPLTLQSSSVTLQGNTFNGVSQLLQLNSSSKVATANILVEAGSSTVVGIGSSNNTGAPTICLAGSTTTVTLGGTQTNACVSFSIISYNSTTGFVTNYGNLLVDGSTNTVTVGGTGLGSGGGLMWKCEQSTVATGDQTCTWNVRLDGLSAASHNFCLAWGTSAGSWTIASTYKNTFTVLPCP